MFFSRIDFGVLTLGLLAFASLVRSQDEAPGAEALKENASPRLLLKTDEAFVHFVPWAPPQEARWDWSPYGELHLTQRRDGAMTRLMSSGVEALPTRRIRYVETRIEAVGVVKEELVAVVRRSVSWDRPPNAWRKERLGTPTYAAEETLSTIQSVRVFSMIDGKLLRERSLADVDCSRLKETLQLSPAAKAEPIALTEDQAAKFLALLEGDPRSAP